MTLIVALLIALVTAGSALYIYWRNGSRLELYRRKLAQELHDGVGSDLTSIIAALETGTPQQRVTAMSLRHCLAELKLLVDGISQEGNVVEHLASLRYRLQPLLQSAGIQMHWSVFDEELLERVQGDAAIQVLRIAQEALANVVRHSSANEVAVVCRYGPANHALILEIVDNGVGLPSGLAGSGSRPLSPEHGHDGKGLAGMAWRARSLGGQLEIAPVCGGGTRVRLHLPM